MTDDEINLPKGFRMLDDYDCCDEFDYSDSETDACCYCGDPDTDSTPSDEDGAPRKKFKTNRCHVACEQELYID